MKTPAQKRPGPGRPENRPADPTRIGGVALDATAAQLEALGNPTRLAIYRLLVRAGEDGRPVGQIQAQLDVAASTLSHHLKHLETAGLILRRKDGVTHYCSANYGAMDALIAFLTEECCVEAAPAGKA